ncbi:acetate--CoA ligase [Desulfovermiculus halophilus]|uniref:acetate--CoA ligase n=1 Tax=Desulfovermiculus halophilus TaxID=339722 RepID=UPI000481F89D|nr:acetate--CoA ligase [Desulfovermiculus halophilus]
MSSQERHYESHWQEEEYYYQNPEFIGQANITDPGIFDRMSLDNFPECYKEFADLLDWDQYWHTTLDTSDAPCWKWFVGGRLNACYNCVDRHLDSYKNKTAIHFVPELEEEPVQNITYQELYRRVNETAIMLRDFCGLKAGDRVTLYLPMTPELPITMLACARLGIIHCQVFAGFSGKACGDRIWDSESEVLITMDAYYRSGKLLNHKANADEAVKAAEEQGQKVNKVLVWRRYPGTYSSSAPVVEGRDYFVDQLLEKYKRQEIAPASMPAEDILFLMYTSGSTGKPKGCQHSIGGYLSYVAWMSKYVQDIHPEDVYWCMADIGWITGHSFIVYGPLAVAASTVVYEGVPTYPDAGRCWRIAEELDVDIFHTSPTAIRALRKVGGDEPAKYNYSFKHMTTVGEPIEPEVWRWYYEVVGKGKAVIVDTWWQTETGGFLCSTLPGIQPMKPGSAGTGLPGIHPVILDDEGNEIQPGEGKAGNLCIKNPWPGAFQTIWKNKERYIDSYYGKYCRDKNSTDWRDWPYMAGDAAVMSADGYVRILGRIDDVINVSGHRLGTKEIESAALAAEEVAEAAVVAVTDEIKGAVPELYVSLKPDYDPSDDLAKKVSDAVADVLGKIAKPSNVYIVPDMPKTRSGKIMRRVLASISSNKDVGDVSTLANPQVVEEIRRQVQSG